MSHGDGSSSGAAASGGFGDAATARLQYPQLTRTNYAAWATRMKILMKILMRAHGVWDAVDPKSSSKVVDEKKDQMALVIISQAINDETLMRVVEKDTALDVWTALRSMHVGAERVREARIQSLSSEFDNLKMCDADSVDDFATKFTMLVGQIRELGETMEEKYVVKKLLRAVSDKFINVALSMALFGDINQMAVEEAIGSLKAHEELLKGRDTRTEEQLLMARGYDSSRG